MVFHGVRKKGHLLQTPTEITKFLQNTHHVLVCGSALYIIPILSFQLLKERTQQADIKNNLYSFIKDNLSETAVENTQKHGCENSKHYYQWCIVTPLCVWLCVCVFIFLYKYLVSVPSVENYGLSFIDVRFNLLIFSGFCLRTTVL